MSQYLRVAGVSVSVYEMMSTAGIRPCETLVKHRIYGRIQLTQSKLLISRREPSSNDMRMILTQ